MKQPGQPGPSISTRTIEHDTYGTVAKGSTCFGGLPSSESVSARNPPPVLTLHRFFGKLGGEGGQPAIDIYLGSHGTPTAPLLSKAVFGWDHGKWKTRRNVLP